MHFFLSRLQSNWKSGLTVALVSVPMSVSLAVASGTNPTVGIITAVWAGLLGAIFGGSHFDIMGPAGALSGILAAFALQQGAHLLPMLAIVTGVIVFISYALRFEKYLTFIPASTVHGFTLGVGLILAFGQMGFAFGLPTLPRHQEFFANVIEAFKHIGSSHIPTTITFIVTLALMFVFLKYVKKVPPAIIVTPFAILLGYLGYIGELPFALQTLGEKFPNISSTLFILPTFHIDVKLLTTALTVAFVAILETMLCGKVADGMTGTKYNRRKEMFGLSIANIGAGLAGGLPATAVLARTALNAKSGANHKMSQGINAVFVAIISLVFLGTFKYIPLSVIAAILVFTSIRMIESHHFIRMYRYDKISFGLSLIVAFATLYWDPTIGILVGTAVSLLFFVEKISKGQFELIANDIAQKAIVDRISGVTIKTLPENCDTLVYSVKGELAYINAQAHISRFETIPDHHKNIVLRMRELSFIDLDGVDAFDEIVDILEKQGKKVLVTGINPILEKSFADSKAYTRLTESKLVFERTGHALSSLGY
ncbi:MAG: SulP family inorganic anion transporter [Candidatus Taylorbacteria bacterium]|nr:SulP family inorganic anion transporter [Candidatus Taylorbacteria bacterium]